MEYNSDDVIVKPPREVTGLKYLCLNRYLSDSDKIRLYSIETSYLIYVVLEFSGYNVDTLNPSNIHLNQNIVNRGNEIFNKLYNDSGLGLVQYFNTDNVLIDDCRQSPSIQKSLELVEEIMNAFVFFTKFDVPYRIVIDRVFELKNARDVIGVFSMEDV